MGDSQKLRTYTEPQVPELRPANRLRRRAATRCPIRTRRRQFDPLSTEKGSTLDAHMAERPNPFGHRRSTAKGWSIYGAQRAQPVATGGKWDTAKTAQIS